MRDGVDAGTARGGGGGARGRAFFKKNVTVLIFFSLLLTLIFIFRCSSPFPKSEISRSETSRRRNTGLGLLMPKGASFSIFIKYDLFISSGAITASAC